MEHSWQPFEFCTSSQFIEFSESHLGKTQILYFTGENVETCRRTKTHIFRSSNVQTFVNLLPSVDIFKRTYTKLNIQVSVHPGDRQTQEEILRQRRMILEEYSDHSLRINNRKSFDYVVGDSNIIPTLCKPAFYYTFALLGLSLPYRWCVYLNVGHVKFKINKRVFEEQAIPPESTVSQEVEISPLLPSPTASLLRELDRPPDYSACVQPETPPPDYETVCGIEMLKLPSRYQKMHCISAS